jgi:hypothetical protein
MHSLMIRFDWTGLEEGGAALDHGRQRRNHVDSGSTGKSFFSSNFCAIASFAI